MATIDLDALCTPYKEAVEVELRALLEERRQPLYQMMRYQMGWVDAQGNPQDGGEGKRLRPILCLLSCEALGGDYLKAIPAAAAVELVHNFSLVHDDVQDGAPERHHRASVWWVWGPAQAINAGDGLHALARLALFRMEKRGVPTSQVLKAIQLLDRASLRLCEGQFLDLSYMERVDITVNAYLDMIKDKTGALFGCAMTLGALAVTQEPAVLDLFYRIGEKLGQAFQIRDDILDMWGAPQGQIAGADILNKKKTLPIAYAFQKAAPKEKRELGTLYFKRVLEPQDVGKVLATLDGLGARDFAEKVCREFRDESLELLGKVEAAPERVASIRAVADYMINRQE